MTDAANENKKWSRAFVSAPFFCAIGFCVALVVFEYYFFPPKYARLIFNPD